MQIGNGSKFFECLGGVAIDCLFELFGSHCNPMVGIMVGKGRKWYKNLKASVIFTAQASVTTSKQRKWFRVRAKSKPSKDDTPLSVNNWA